MSKYSKEEGCVCAGMHIKQKCKRRVVFSAPSLKKSTSRFKRERERKALEPLSTALK